jgi:gamma-glutamyltranspeptidase
MHALSSAGKSWAIATPHWAATDIGASSFREGGNAVDAALASGVALAVAYPHNCSAGGDLFALVKRPTGDVIAINASGAAPAALTIDGVPTGDGWPERGPFTVTVPGVVGGWQALSAQGARLGFRHGFERARAKGTMQEPRAAHKPVETVTWARRVSDPMRPHPTRGSNALAADRPESGRRPLHPRSMGSPP